MNKQTLLKLAKLEDEKSRKADNLVDKSYRAGKADAYLEIVYHMRDDRSEKSLQEFLGA